MNDETAKVETPSHVTKERDDLEYASNDLIDITTILEEKLKNVLTNEPPQPENPDKVSTEVVPLAENLRRSKEKIQMQIGKLRSIYNRLEN